MSAGDGDGDGADRTLTLAFELGALEAVERPRSVFEDARTWSRNVGIVSRAPRAGERYARDHGIAQDFFTGDRGARESLALVERQFGTDRYVFVGTTDEDRRLAEATGWEYRSIEEAAAAADWDLDTPSGLVSRIARILADRL